MESLLKDRILQHLVLHQLIRSSQHGFMPGRSTLTNLLTYLETLTALVDEGHAVDVLYLDFAKAFDKVPHARLLAKCSGLGLGGKVLSWVREWLTGRQQRVILNGKYSEWGDVVSGVPQGSVHGPLLFVIFINDIDCAVEITGSTIIKFADDTKWAMVVDSEEQSQAFQEGIRSLEGWSREWQMLFNLGKCHVLHLGSRNSKHEYSMGGEILEATDSEKDVGIHVHQSLKPSLQCAKASAKANQVLGQLSRAVGYRDEDTFLKLYCVYVRPHLEYAIKSWCPWQVQDKNILEKVQRRAVMMVSNMRGKTYEERLLEANMTTLETRRHRGDLIQMYRIMSGKDDVSPNTWFQTMADNRGDGVGTRQATGLYNVLPKQGRSEIREHFFSQRVVAPWNSLPNWVKQSTTVNMFKNRLDEHMEQGVLQPH